MTGKAADTEQTMLLTLHGSSSHSWLLASLAVVCHSESRCWSWTSLLFVIVYSATYWYSVLFWQMFQSIWIISISFILWHVILKVDAYPVLITNRAHCTVPEISLVLILCLCYVLLCFALQQDSGRNSMPWAGNDSDFVTGVFILFCLPYFLSVCGYHSYHNGTCPNAQVSWPVLCEMWAFFVSKEMESEKFSSHSVLLHVLCYATVFMLLLGSNSLIFFSFHILIA